MLRLRFCTRLSTAPAGMRAATCESAPSRESAAAGKSAAVDMYGMDAAAGILSKVCMSEGAG